MSMDLFSSCSAAYSSHAMLMWQYSLSGMDQCNSLSESSEVSVSNRMIRHPDGTIEIIAKTPGEVLGEKVREAVSDKWGLFKKASSLFNGAAAVVQQGADILTERLVSFDRLFTRAVTFLPVAEAQGTGTGVVPYDQFRNDYSPKSLLGVDTHSYGDYVASLEPKYCLELIKDRVLQDNYNMFIKEMNNLVLFMIEASNVYDTFMQTTVVKECQLLHDVEHFLKKETEQLSDKFALPPQDNGDRIFRLQLPKNTYHSDGTATSQQKFSFTNTQQSVAIKLYESASQFLPSCQENPVVLVMKDLFSPYVSALIALNMNRGVKFTYEQFTELFKDQDAVKNTLEQIKKYKEYIQSNMQTIKSLSLGKINKRVHDQVESIKRQVHLIHDKQKAKADEKWPGWYLYTDTVSSGMQYCTAWKVKEYRRTYWNQPVFSFELVT